MKLCTTTALLSEACDDSKLISGPEAVRRLSEAGYESLDFNFSFFRYEDYILRGEGWERRIDEVAEMAAKCGVTFAQSHIPFCKISHEFDPFLKDPLNLEYFNECTRRAYIASGMLGVRYATIHPLTDIRTFSAEDSLKRNHEYYDSYIELGMKYQVGSAYENMFTPYNRSVVVRYCQHPDELAELVDSYGSQKVGVCWDFGHANEAKLDQPGSLRRLGKRIKNLHINDNSGTRDEHLLPFLGTVDWFSVIPVLAEIGYDGDLAFEAGQMTRKAARGIQDVYVEAAVKCGKFLMQIYEEAKEKQGV